MNLLLLWLSYRFCLKLIGFHGRWFDLLHVWILLGWQNMKKHSLQGLRAIFRFKFTLDYDSGSCGNKRRRTHFEAQLQSHQRKWTTTDDKFNTQIRKQTKYENCKLIPWHETIENPHENTSRSTVTYQRKPSPSDDKYNEQFHHQTNPPIPYHSYKNTDRPYYVLHSVVPNDYVPLFQLKTTQISR